MRVAVNFALPKFTRQRCWKPARAALRGGRLLRPPRRAGFFRCVGILSLWFGMPGCPASADGNTHWVGSRCFNVYTPGGAHWPMPVLILHHGRTGGATQFCRGSFTAVASSRGFALVCTAAIRGDWRFGDPERCLNDNNAVDLCCVNSIIARLKSEPHKYDALRIFHAGFSQGALFAAYVSFCLCAVWPARQSWHLFANDARCV